MRDTLRCATSLSLSEPRMIWLVHFERVRDQAVQGFVTVKHLHQAQYGTTLVPVEKAQLRNLSLRLDKRRTP